MIWADWSSFWGMGGHGAYVWASVGAALLALGAESIALRVRDRENRAHAARRGGAR